MSDDLGPWPEKMYLLHPSLKSFGDRVTYPERREYVLADRIEELEHKVEQFRDTNRRMNRRVQLLEGWWQRKVERANYWRRIYQMIFAGKNPHLKAVEEAAYQRGYEEGFEQKFFVPKRIVKPRRGGETK